MNERVSLALPIPTPRLILRAAELGDADQLFELHSDPDYVRFVGQDITRERFDEVFRGEIEGSSSIFAFPAIERESGVIVGECALIYSTVREAELVMALLPAYRRKSFSYEMGRAVIEACFGGGMVDRVIACVDPQNEAALRLVVKLGMSRGRDMTRSSGQMERWEASAQSRTARLPLQGIN